MVCKTNAHKDTDFTLKEFSKKSMTLAFIIFKLQIAPKYRSANIESALIWDAILLSFLRSILQYEGHPISSDNDLIKRKLFL